MVLPTVEKQLLLRATGVTISSPSFYYSLISFESKDCVCNILTTCLGTFCENLNPEMGVGVKSELKLVILLQL